MRRQGIIALVIAAGCGDTSGYQPGEERSGGDTTVFDVTRDAYSRAARNLSQARRDAFFVGNSFFNRSWVTAPSSTTGVDGLGPTFNATSCSACHFKDGRAAPPVGPDEIPLGLLVRISIEGQDAHGGPLGAPGYGGQLQTGAILGVDAEADVRIRWEETPGEYLDGEAYSLRRPVVEVREPAFGALPSELLMSPRVAPAVFGLGLLEAIEEAVLLESADEMDADGDGISGRPNRVWDVEQQALVIGRLGWKSNQPSVMQQNAGAFSGDMGITSTLFPEQNCPAGQDGCRRAPDGGPGPEIDEEKLDAVEFYVRTLAVPGRRDHLDPQVLAGKALFHEAGCASCHRPSMVTGTSLPELSGQTIYPYSDLLLHDMGGGLSDRRPDYLATGEEWRTPPLWGIGLQKIVNRHTHYLHDGRARDLAEAILWHGGEGGPSRAAFEAMPASDRAALIRFLESL